MRRCLAWLLAVLLVAPLLASCAGVGGPREAIFEDLIGGRWHWVGVLSDLGATAVPEPALYWAEFAAAGGIVVLADCNGGVGRVGSGPLTIGPIGLTRRMCGPASLDTRFAAMPSQVRSGAFDGELLRLRTREGDLVFVRDARANLQTFVCPAAVPQAVVFGGEYAYVLEGARFRPLARLASTSGERYADDQVSLLRTGKELLLQSSAATSGGPCMRDETAAPRETR